MQNKIYIDTKKYVFICMYALSYFCTTKFLSKS